MARAPSLTEALAQASAPSLDDVLATDAPNFDFGGFSGGSKVGERAFENKVAESKTPEFQRQAAIREAATARKAKPIETDSELGVIGQTFWQRVRGLGAGGGRLALTGLEEAGIDPAGDAAQWLRAKTQAAEEYQARPIEGQAKARPFRISEPARSALATSPDSCSNRARRRWRIWACLQAARASRSTSGCRRVAPGSSAPRTTARPTPMPRTFSRRFRLPSAARRFLRRSALHGIFGAGARSVVGRIAQAFGTEALTEALQSPIEYAGSNLGTDAGFDPMEAANQALQGAIAGGAMGGGIRGAIETPGAIARRMRGETISPGVMRGRRRLPSQSSRKRTRRARSPTDLIAEGKRVTGTATAMTDANRILTDNGAPEVGSKVTVNVGGKPRTGTVRDAFVDESDADLGAQPGLQIDLDGGGSMREFFADLKDAGVSIEAASIDPGSIDRALADMEAGGLSPAATLDAVAETGETPTAPSLDELAPAAAAPVARASGAFDTNAYIARARGAESGGNDAASNTRSSASGRYQFTDSTFARYYQKVFGTVPPAGAKNDPAIQDRLMKVMTDENIAGLKASGIPVNDATVYATHHFGLGGAREMVNNPSAAVNAAIVKANPQFKGMNNAEALAWTARHIGAIKGGNSFSEPSARPTPIEEVERDRLIDAPLTTQQVTAPTRAPDSDSVGFDGMAGDTGMAAGMGEVLRDALWAKVEAGSTKEGGQDSPLLQAAKQIRDRGGNLQRSDLTALGVGVDAARASNDFQGGMRALVAQFAPTASTTPSQEPAAAAAPAYTITETPSGKGIAIANLTDEQKATISAAIPKASATPSKSGLVFAAKYRAQIEEALSSSTPALTPAAELTSQQQRESVQVSDSLPGGMPVAEAAAAARAVQARKPARTRTGPVDAVTFLADLGGIQDTEGHSLKQRARGQGAGSRDISQFAPGGGHVFRKDGMTIDEAGEALQEAGYFTERPTTRQVLEMLDRSAFENQYRPADIPDVEQRRAERRDENDREGARVAASAALDEIGIDDASDTDIEGIAANMSDGRSAAEAVESYYRQQAEARSADYYDQTNDAEFDVPFDGPASRSADFGNVEGFERSAPVARGAEGSDAPGRGTVEDRPAQADAFGERDGDQRRALERASEGRSRATAAQKPAGSDGGLFDNNASQPDMLSAPAPDARAEQLRKQGARGAAPAAEVRRPVDKKNPNSLVREGERYTFTQRVGYLGGGNPADTYVISGRPGKREAYFTNEASGGSSSLNNYEIERGLKDGTIKRVDAPAAVAAPADEYETLLPEERAALEKALKSEKSGGLGWAKDSSAGMAVQRMLDDGRFSMSNDEDIAATALRLTNKAKPVDTPPATPTPPSSPKYGTENKLVTTDRAEVIRQKLREKMNNINSGIDPEVLALGAELAVFHIEAGARKFGDFSSRMIADIGESVRPFLRSFYESARYYPGMDAIARDMSTAAQIEEEGNGDQGAVRPGDARASAEDVQRDAEDGSARRAPDGEGQGSGRDVQADQRGEPTHLNGLLKDDQRRREIEDQVRGNLIEFPPEMPTPDEDGENVPQPVTRSA